MMLAQNYTYSMYNHDHGVIITLTKTSDQRTKTFFLAGGTIDSLTKHMESLTDENCDGFFPADRVKKIKQPKIEPV